jgi:hypothetical protein
MPNMSQELVDQLARYGGVTVVDAADLTETERQAMPSWWVDAVAVEGPDAVRWAAARWRDAAPGLFPRTLEVFEDRAAGVFIGRETGAASTPLILVYVLAAADEGAHDRFVCWYGSPPADHLDNRTTEFRPGGKADLTQLPNELRSFYTRVHNRFRLAGHGEAGLFAVDDLFTLDGEPDDYE